MQGRALLAPRSMLLAMQTAACGAPCHQAGGRHRGPAHRLVGSAACTQHGWLPALCTAEDSPRAVLLAHSRKGWLHCAQQSSPQEECLLHQGIQPVDGPCTRRNGECKLCRPV